MYRDQVISAQTVTDKVTAGALWSVLSESLLRFSVLSLIVYTINQLFGRAAEVDKCVYVGWQCLLFCVT